MGSARRPRPRMIAAVVSAALLAAATAPAAAQSVVPPAAPVADCVAGSPSPLVDIDRCRAAEGIGALTLPGNYASLTKPEQMLVLFNLERISRGEAPIVGLSAALDADAALGLSHQADPPLVPAYVGHSVYAAGVTSITAADDLWMYQDGYGGVNGSCTSPHAPACWGHRDSILTLAAGNLVGGGATAGEGAAFVFESGYPAVALNFTWAGELRYFSVPPSSELLADTLPAGHRLGPGQELTNPENDDRLVVERGDGAIVLYDGSQKRWSLPTQGHPGDSLVVEPDGNLVAESRSGSLLWSSRTTGHPGDYLVLENDGDLVLSTGARRALWSSRT